MSAPVIAPIQGDTEVIVAEPPSESCESSEGVGKRFGAKRFKMKRHGTRSVANDIAIFAKFR